MHILLKFLLVIKNNLQKNTSGGGAHAATGDYSVNSPFNLTGFPLFSPFQENKQFSFILKNRNFIHRQDRLRTRLIILCVYCVDQNLLLN